MTAQQNAARVESLEVLTSMAVEALNVSFPRLKAWIESVRPQDGTRGRFRWALETTRPPNVGSTSNILGGLRALGLLEELWTEEDRRAGAEWIRSMCIGEDQYRDPALMDPKSPGWPDGEPWPSPAMLNGLNARAGMVLRFCVPPDEADDEAPCVPPPGWPQPDDDPAAAIDWIKTRPWDKNAWGAASHAMRMARWLIQWRREGRIPLEPAIEALQFFYDTQDPETGLWGAPHLPLFNRINGTFKLFPLLRAQLDLPLPHADRIIDQVMAEFYRPDYDETVGACDEWDNWYVVLHARPEAGGHREDEISRVAAWRIARILEVFTEPDGGLSYCPHRCGTSWIGFDMAPALPQGDAMGPAVLVPSVNACANVLGLQGASPWPATWAARAGEDDDGVRKEILSRLRIGN